MKIKPKSKTYPFIIGFSLLLFLIFYFTQHQFIFFAGLICLIIPVISFRLAEIVFHPIISAFEIVGRINSYIILGIFFLLFLTPLAFVQKIFSKTKKTEPTKSELSFFHKEKYKYSNKDFKKSW